MSEGVLAASAASEVAAARAAFQAKDYPLVLERALAASDALGIVRENHRRAKDALASAERQLAEATGLGADLRESVGRLADARRVADAGQYLETIRAAREATEMARWAIEKMFAGPLGDLRRVVEQGRREKLTTEIDPVEAIVAEGEAALRGREWTQVREAIERGEVAVRRAFEVVVDARWRTVEEESALAGAVPAAETARREEVRQRLAGLREKRDFAAALELIRAERELVHRRRRERVETQIAELKAQLWVGERLGLDTTPIMQTFSEARSATDTGTAGRGRSTAQRGAARAREGGARTVRPATPRGVDRAQFRPRGPARERRSAPRADPRDRGARPERPGARRRARAPLRRRGAQPQEIPPPRVDEP